MPIPLFFLRWSRRRHRGPLEVFEHQHTLETRLQELLPAHEVAQPSLRLEEERLPYPSDVRFSLEEHAKLEWKIAFTAQFTKAISGADRSMQGRILLALAEIANVPHTPKGDTIKPLSGRLRGLWRYRLGDYRLVYEPEEAKRLVVLLDFAPRGGAYE